MFRWGILSTAKIAREHLMPAIFKSTNGVVGAIASRDLGRAREAAERCGAATAFGSYGDLLASPDIDGVYIPLPTSQHVEWTLRAIAAGKHVLCEKPMAIRASDIDRVAAAAREHDVLVSEAFMVFYHPQWRKVRDLIAAGAIGRLVHVQAAFSYRNLDPANMRNRPELGGGALLDIGVYPVVTTRLATGAEPARARASVHTDPRFGTDGFVTGQLDFGEFEMSFYLGTGIAQRQAIVFHGEEGWIEMAAPFNAGLYDGDKVFLHAAARDKTEVWRFPGVDQYRLEVEAFADRALGGAAEIFPLASSRRNQAAIDALFASGRSGQWESVGG